MLTEAGCRARRERLLQAAGDVDFLLIADPQHVTYLTGFYPSPFEFLTVNAAAVLIVERSGEATLVGDNFLEGFAAQAWCDQRVMPVWYRGVESAAVRRSALLATLIARFEKVPGRKIGYEPGSVPAGAIEALRAARGALTLVDIEPALHALKRRKDPDEVVAMRAAIHAAEAGFAAGLEKVRPGMTELDVFTLVEAAVHDAAGERVRVYGDFVSGERTGDGGGPPSRRTIAPGELVLMDFSAIVGGYRGDFANTFVCGEEPTLRQRQLYHACLSALQAAEAILAPGLPGREVDAAIRASFAEQGLAEHFTSHAGHGLGLGHPDPPFLVRESVDTLVEGDIIAVEPGLYFKNEYGLRYERNYRITADGCEILSHHALQIAQV